MAEGVKLSAELQSHLEKKLHELEREAVMAIVNNRDFQFGTVLGLQMNLGAVIRLEASLLGEASGLEGILKREAKGFARREPEPGPGS